MPPRLLLLLALCLVTGSGRAAITITNIADKTKYDAPRSFNVTADPNAATTTATLDGTPVPVGLAVNVTAIGYHELKAESRTAGGALVDSRTVRFITRDPLRGGTEDGIPPHTPFRLVNDAPSAFAGQTLKVIAPAAWPVGLPVPLAATLRSATNEPVRLNGVVTFAGFPQTTLQMRRGWGSTLAPAATSAATFDLAAAVNGLVASRPITLEAALVFTTVSGAISSNTAWPPNSRIHVTGTLTVNVGATLTIGAGTIVKIYTGTGTEGSAAEIVVNGALQVNGTEASPVIFTPDTAGQFWGGIELPTAASTVNASFTIFTGSGEDADWFDTHSGYTTHRPQQALFLIAGSGSGTAVGAQLHLTDCFCFGLAGQQMNSRTNTWIDLQRTLMQRAVTGGELNGSKVTIDRCALIEFPSEDGAFADADNDAIYLTNGDLSITKTVIDFTKDDGVDSGGSGGDNPYTAVADVTPFLSQGNWFESIFHEGNSLSGTRNVSHLGNVFFNCGQGVEDGYSNSGTSDGPNAIVDGCLFVSNMVGVRWGDNYGSGYSYNGSMEVKNSLVLSSLYRDAFSGQWHPTQANAWIYQDATATNSFGRPYFNVHDNFLSQPDALHHPLNTLWNPANPSHASLLAPFMPVPGSAVGVAISSYAPAQSDPAAFPGVFTVRLSTFSSHPVTVNWSIVGKLDPFSETQSILGRGLLTFAPGETLKTISTPVASPANYALIHVALTDSVNAEVTGDAWYIQSPTPDPTLVARASTGWRYRETRSEPPADWKQLAFDDSSAAATEWLPCTLPAGFGVSGITFGTTVTPGSASDRTRTFYFRKKFHVADPASVQSLTFRVRRDDGVLAWLNDGATPIANSADPHPTGLVPLPATYLTLAPSANDTTSYFSFDIPVSKLVPGDNILAVELHQASVTSGDVLLDCELIATFIAPFELHLTHTGGAPALYWFDSDAQLEKATDLTLGDWAPLPGAQSPLSLDLAAPKSFFRLRK